MRSVILLEVTWESGSSELNTGFIDKCWNLRRTSSSVVRLLESKKYKTLIWPWIQRKVWYEGAADLEEVQYKDREERCPRGAGAKMERGQSEGRLVFSDGQMGRLAPSWDY